MALSTLTSSYPQGMGSYNNRSNIGGYVTWKGAGIGSNHVAVTAGNIRPLTNRDYTNITPGPTPINPSCAGRFSFVKRNFLPRPLKWAYRKGTTTPIPPQIVEDPDNPGTYITLNSPSFKEFQHKLDNIIVALLNSHVQRGARRLRRKVQICAVLHQHLQTA